MGWDCDVSASWILRPANSFVDRQQFQSWWENADVVVCGNRMLDRFENRINQKRICYYMSERWWKPPVGIARMLHPNFFQMAFTFRRLSASPFFHFLSIGYHSAADIHRIALFKTRLWQWGYFTEPPSPAPKPHEKKGPTKVMWAGRMLRWKRVDTLIHAFKMLLGRRPDAQLTIVGDGPERIRLSRLAQKLLPAGNFTFMRPLPAQQVLELMKVHHVYVLPSDAYEGWGAVINEAMDAGCVVICSREAGASRTLIRHGQNGLLFSSGHFRQLGRLMINMAIDRAARVRLARNGQESIERHWSPAIAAVRLLSVSDALLSRRIPPEYIDGPMARIDL